MPKERYVRKEGNGCTNPFYIGCNKRPEERHVLTDWMFSVHKIISKFGYDPKERHGYTQVKWLDPKESHGSFY